MTSASTMVETMLKNSVWYVRQMAIYMVCNIFLFFLNSPSELTFWITLICDGPLVNDWQNILDLGSWGEMMMQQHPTHFDPEHGDIFSGMLTFMCKWWSVTIQRITFWTWKHVIYVITSAFFWIIPVLVLWTVYQWTWGMVSLLYMWQQIIETFLLHFINH